jgi:SAM-dependent methyltransferase
MVVSFQPSSRPQETFYDLYWREGRVGDSPHVRWKAERTQRLGTGRPVARVLDVGCGDGLILGRAGRPGWSLFGVEVSAAAAHEATRRGVRAIRVDLERARLPLRSESFDLVICYDVLEHLFDPMALLSEVHRILRGDGTALFCVPNAFNLFNRLTFLAGRYADITDTSHSSNEFFTEHIRLFSKRLFETVVARADFSVKSRHFYFPDEFTDSRFQLAGYLARVVTETGIHRLWPSLLSLGFLYECVKTKIGGVVSSLPEGKPSDR